MHFFLGSDQDDDEMEASDDEATLLSHPHTPPLNGRIIGPRFEDVTTPSRNQQKNSFRGEEDGKTNKENEKGTCTVHPRPYRSKIFYLETYQQVELTVG